MNYGIDLRNYEAVIGLEVHAQLSTDTKIFCGCSTKFGNPANSNVCPVCLGHPGVLPVLNKKVVEYSVMMGMATGSRINENSIFARKNYFYPDLPKGYQISQFELPICEDGVIKISTEERGAKEIRIKRIHMEEDAGKSIHDRGYDTHVDVNRCGVPLIEIVSEPDISSPEEAYEYLTKLKQILLYLDICDGNMEEGSLRCDANISIRPVGQKELGTRTEVKNMNSFRNVEKAIRFEIERQTELVDDGGKVVQETLLWNADLNEAFPMRGKEESHDYRYFPDPDLVKVVVDEKWKEGLKERLPELPAEKMEKFVNVYNLPEYDASILTLELEVAKYFEECVKYTKDTKSVSNWVMTEILKYLNENKVSIAQFPATPENLAKLVNLINDRTISGKIAKDIFPEMIQGGKSPEVIVKEKNLVQISDDSVLEPVIDEIIATSEKEVKTYLAGKEKAIGALVGKAMKATKGKANPQMVNKLLKEKLEAMKTA
ncbi:MAG: aspartyl/glutamyl-tRNA(Asn/Gln) amidotransferase subunit B [Melioribacteraceae bacterium]|nr:MAG: aspartyl/glutamyl-tRNA(Asn/Gln) amidotransferase subunit B [Melioribacteraceae bacterium]